MNGGTQANQLVIDTLLQPYEGVVAAQSGHVNVHEAGAIEFSGHKVLAIPSGRHDGKLAAADVDAFATSFYADPSHEHMVFPGMVYISHPTEYGTLYTAQELRELSAVCHRHHMSFYLDGARLVYGLAAYGTDVTLPLLAALCDVFYLGGTKAGALNGEAIVFPRGAEPSHFLTRIKQHGALSAKGRLIGIQFTALLENDLYFRIGRHAIDMAREIRKISRTRAAASIWIPRRTSSSSFWKTRLSENYPPAWDLNSGNHTTRRTPSCASPRAGLPHPQASKG